MGFFSSGNSDDKYQQKETSDEDRRKHDRAVYESTHSRDDSNKMDVDKRYNDWKEGYTNHQ